nr:MULTISPECIES: hypothetical protein [Microbacterium]
MGTDAEAAASPLDEALVADDAATAAEPATTADATADGTAPHYGIGPFSLREVVLGGVWLLAFVVSFFPIYGAFGSGPSVWNGGIDWVLTIGVPTVAVFLIALRRLSPQGIRRVGSLGIDQFASVAFSVSTIVWLGILWGAFVSFAGGRVFIATWVVWLEFFLMLAGVFLTVLAPFIAPFNEDFRHRPEITAHRSARPARPVTARPAAVPAAADPYAAAAATTANAYDAGANPYAPSEDPYARDAQTFQSLDDTTVLDQQGQQEQPQAAAPAATQAFWALAPVERDVVDEQGLPLFAVGPTAWALVIEDRGDTFVVRHEDGRIGYLTDVSGVTRG